MVEGWDLEREGSGPRVPERDQGGKRWLGPGSGSGFRIEGSGSGLRARAEPLHECTNQSGATGLSVPLACATPHPFWQEGYYIGREVPLGDEQMRFPLHGPNRELPRGVSDFWVI